MVLDKDMAHIIIKMEIKYPDHSIFNQPIFIIIQFQLLP